jgi:hypothetical protein
LDGFSSDEDASGLSVRQDGGRCAEKSIQVGGGDVLILRTITYHRAII